MKKPFLFFLSILFIISCNTENKSPEYEKGYAEVNGTKLYYEIIGSGEPIVFVHGNYGDIRHWDLQIEAFSERFKVIRYDVRGYGNSSLPDSVTSYRDNDDLRALMDYLEIDKAHICGLSMGSGIATDFALAYPERCLSLIPIGPWIGGWGGGQYSTDATDSAITILGKVYDLISKEGPKAATDYLWAGNHELKTNVVKPSTLDSLLKMGYEYSWWGFLNPNKREAYYPPAVEVLNTIKVPTLIVTADHDVKACQELAELMKSEIQNSQFVSIQNAGHCMNMDNPQEFNKVVINFIDRL